MPGHDYRTLGLVYQVCGTGHLINRCLGGRVVAGKIRLFRPDELGAQILEYVLWYVHQHRPGTPGACDVERFLYRWSHVFNFHHQEIVLGDGERDSGNVGFLESVPADRRSRHLPGDSHQRHRIHLGGRNPGYQVGCPRAAGRRAHAHPSGGAGIAVCCHRRCLLVPHQYMAQPRVFGHGAVKRQHRAAGQAEYDVYPLLQEALANNLSAAKFHISCQRMDSPRIKDRL